MSGRVHQAPVGPIHVGGRRRPTAFPALARLSKYVCKSRLPTPPETLAYPTIAKPGLANILGNDKLGDCTSAGAWHLVVAWLASVGITCSPTEAQAILFYEKSTGYNPRNPASDQGGNELDVLAYWKKHGLDGKGLHKIEAVAQVDAHDEEMLRIGNWLFGLYNGGELPDADLQVEGDGFVWLPGKPNMSNGHCFMSRAHNKDGLEVDSWGFLGLLTWAAAAEMLIAENYGMSNAILSRESIDAAKNLAPSGFDFDQLEHDLTLVKAA